MQKGFEASGVALVIQSVWPLRIETSFLVLTPIQYYRRRISFHRMAIDLLKEKGFVYPVRKPDEDSYLCRGTCLDQVLQDCDQIVLGRKFRQGRQSGIWVGIDPIWVHVMTIQRGISRQRQQWYRTAFGSVSDPRSHYPMEDLNCFPCC